MTWVELAITWEILQIFDNYTRDIYASGFCRKSHVVSDGNRLNLKAALRPSEDGPLLISL